MSYSIIKNQDTFQKAKLLARRSFQLAVLFGSESMSGADLQGNAKLYIGKYRQSAQNFITRCKLHGLNVYEVRGKRNRRELVID
jgi:hypothetical protein